jgi:hypothetical protein
MTSTQHVYEIRPRKDKHGFDLVSDALRFGRVWYTGSNAVSHAIECAKTRSRSHDFVIRLLRRRWQRDRDIRAQGRFQRGVIRSVASRPVCTIVMNLSRLFIGVTLAAFILLAIETAARRGF